MPGYCEALKLVPREWRGEFTRFVDEGEASAEFLAYLDTSDDCQQAIETVLRADADTAAIFERTATEVKTMPEHCST